MVCRCSLVVLALLLGPAAPGRARAPEPVETQSCGETGPRDVRLRPSSGPIGTRIRITGRCFDAELNRFNAYGVFLLRQFMRPRECELISGGRQRFRVDEDGDGRGYLVVSARGHCYQHEYGRRVTPARYSLGIGSHASQIGQFRVTEG